MKIYHLHNYKHMDKKILYIDMDNVLVDYKSGMLQFNCIPYKQIRI